MLIVGLTGGIGCGKSAAAEIFERLGATVIDTDQIAHQLTALGQPAVTAIQKQFGADYVLPDGNLNRSRLRNLVFSDAVAKKQLEALLHPLIKDEVCCRLAVAQTPYTIITVPLLLETGAYRELVQRTLVVDCAEDQQASRAMARSGLNEEEVRAIMACQVSRSERLRLADDIIDNHGERSELQQQVEQLHHQYLQLA
ncbi:dephospho-CoA kinase [Sulfurimicrobium lacus]|uniref:Dephospho-CoA kinase n=1 Tax=Sulfurimicrobium lacus TaxID=2715678 RepID=A0A6F8VGU0_9PROT|nr:dephospho-CoA kinase [Sulfurimicrobium lacus]BCB28381.1 dephospho-CoA kinase [Sulfurimicrobium lacus]